MKGICGKKSYLECTGNDKMGIVAVINKLIKDIQEVWLLLNEENIKWMLLENRNCKSPTFITELISKKKRRPM